MDLALFGLACFGVGGIIATVLCSLMQASKCEPPLPGKRDFEEERE